MKKRFLALLLVAVMVFGMVPVSVGAATAYGTASNYVYTTAADPATNTVPTAFGTKAANGRVWTDKTVVANQDNFQVTLSALAQEYVQTKQTGTGSKSTPADCLILLDFSLSMQSNKMSETIDGFTVTRAYAMTKALNEALDIIMKANSDNRVLVYGYHSYNQYELLLSFGHYTNTTWETANGTATWKKNSASSATGKYVDYSLASRKFTLSTNSGLKKDGSSYSRSVTQGMSTPTQGAMAYCIKDFISKVSGKTNTGSIRKPFVMLMTDGDPTVMYSNWWTENPPVNTSENATDTSTYGKVTSADGGDGDNAMAAAAILTSALWVDKLSDAYTAFNGKATKTSLYNIGLGSDANPNDRIKCVLDPTNVADCSGIKTQLNSQAANYKTKDYSLAENYDKAYYSKYCNTYTVLSEAFAKFSKDIEASSAAVVYPIIASEGSGASSDLVFTDVIGEGMTVSTPVMTLWDAENAKAVTVTGTEASDFATSGKYTFAPYKATATVTKSGSQETLVWNIPLEEVSIYTFADRSDLDNGSYIAAEPVTLTYTVSLADAANYDGKALYSNAWSADGAQTTVNFTVAEDNPYYYNVTNNGSGIFVSSTLKQTSGAAQKVTNTTETAKDSIVLTHTAVDKTADTPAHAVITHALGNNGKLSPVVDVNKSVDNASPAPGDTVTYTVTVKNYTKEAVNNISVYDTLPTGLTFAAGYSSPKTISSIAAGATATVTFKAVVSDTVAVGTTLTNTAGLSTINGTALTKKPTDTCQITTVEGAKYTVTYNWGDHTPEKAAPTDSNKYKSTDTYNVDTSAVGTQVADKEGDVIKGYYVFDGWQKGTETVTGTQPITEDVTLTAKWRYQAADTYTIQYVWTAEDEKGAAVDPVPAAVGTKPTDSNTYYLDSVYNINSSFTAGKEVPVKDGDVEIGKWVFSGWTVTRDDTGAAYNGAKMPASDLTATGKWTYRTADTYTIQYIWTAEDDKGAAVNPVPAVVGTKPTDSNTYYLDSIYNINSSFTTGKEVPVKDGDVEIGKWVFSGWTVTRDDTGAAYNGAKMPASDLTATGKWTYRAADTYTIQYVWTAEDEKGAAVNPVPAVVGTKPTDSNTYYLDSVYNINSSFTAGKEVPVKDGDVEIGKWVFSGWTVTRDDTGAAYNGAKMPASDLTATGKWTYHKKVTLTYKSGSDAPNGFTVPDAQTDYPGTAVKPVKDDYDDVIQKDLDGKKYKYTFGGWETIPAVVPDEDTDIIAKWTKTELTKYTVNYDWNLPADATGTISTVKPDAITDYAEEAYTVDNTVTASTKVEKRAADNGVIGYYVFNSWDDSQNNGKVPANNDSLIKGQWDWVPNSKVQVPVKSEKNPEGFVITKPENYPEGEYTFTDPVPVGTEFPVYDPNDPTVIIGYDIYKGFEDPNDGDIPEKGTDPKEIVIKWDYTPAGKHVVNYDWNLPKDATGKVSTALPEKITDYTNATYTVDKSVTSSTKVEKRATDNGVVGYYVFNGWSDPNSGKMPNIDTTLIKAQWTWTPNSKVVVPVKSEKNPEGFVITKPENYPEGEYTFTDPVPVGTEFPVYDPNDPTVIIGYDIYKGFEDPNDGDIPEKGTDPKDIVIKWDYQEATKYTVNYNWNLPADATGTVAEVLPEKITDYANAKYTVDTAITSTTKVEKRAADNGVVGYYVFNGWDDSQNNGKVPANNDSLIKGKWTWAPNSKVEVPVKSDKNPEGFTIPKIENYPEGEYTFTDPVPVGTEFPVYDPNDPEVIIGYDIYKGFEDPNDGDIPEKGTDPKDIVIKWDYKEATKYTVNYDWKLPADATGKITTAKPDAITNYANAKYTADKTVTASTKVEKVAQNGGLVGYYVFNGWDDSQNNGKVPANNDSLIKGKWNFEESQKSTVRYNWGDEHAPEDVDLPESIIDYPGAAYTPDTDTADKDVKIPVYDKTGGIEGYWVFDGWDDPNSGTVPENDSEITAKWVYKPENPVEIPTSWGEFTPKDDKGEPIDLPTIEGYVPGGYTFKDPFEDGTKFPVLDPNDPQVIIGYYEYKGFDDPNSGKFTEEPEVITIKWNYIPADTYTITYVWGEHTPDNGTLPTDPNSYYENQQYTVDSVVNANTKKIVKDAYGNDKTAYVFDGWDKEDGRMPKGNLTVTAKWQEIPIDVPEGSVTYIFTGDVPADVEEPVDPNTYVNNQPYELDTVFKKGDIIKTYDEFNNQNGYYEFQGWDDPNNGVMDTDGVPVLGAWVFTAVPVPEYPVTFRNDDNPDAPVSVTPVINGDKIKVIPNGGDWTFKGTKYSGSQEAVLTADTTMNIPDPTRDGYNFKGWEIEEEEGYGLVVRAKWEEKTHHEKAMDFIKGIEIPALDIPSITLPEFTLPDLSDIFDKAEELVKKIEKEDKEEDDSDIPYTGSESVAYAWVMLVSAMSAAGYLFFTGKKKKAEDAE